MSYNLIAPEGKCQYCGCTEDKPCKLADGETCWWMYRTRNICSAGPCMRRYHADVKKLRLATRGRKLNSAQVSQLIRRKKRRPVVKRPLRKGARG